MNIFENNYLECNEEYAIQHTIFGSVVPLGVAEHCVHDELSLSLTVYIDVHGGAFLEACSKFVRNVPTDGYWSYFPFDAERDDLLIPVNVREALDEVAEIGWAHDEEHIAQSPPNIVEYKARLTQTKCHKCWKLLNDTDLYYSNAGDTLCKGCYATMIKAML